MLLRTIAGLATATLLSACAANGARPVSTADGTATTPIESVPVAAAGPAEVDRRAILSMAGEYRVTFDFKETVVLEPDYKRTRPKESGAYETVIVVADEPERIVLQHILVSREGGHVTKHWRHDWFWQAPTRFEFSDDQTWRVRSIPASVNENAWTQCVYEVSDAPRYCGTGRWTHDADISTWTSDRTWRPLPRREYSKRDDYNALDVENRHTIVPGGWAHEQDNTKIRRHAGSAPHGLVREFGFNDYIRLDEGEFDFSPAYAYWDKTRDYWARVRAEWDARLAATDGIHLDTPVDGMPIIEATFEQAQRIIDGEMVPNDELRAVFDRYVQPAQRAVAAAAD